MIGTQGQPWLTLLLAIAITACTANRKISAPKPSGSTSEENSGSIILDSDEQESEVGKAKTKEKSETLTAEEEKQDDGKNTELDVEEEKEVEITETDILRSLPAGEAQLTKLCARGGPDRVRNLFCQQPRPVITGIRDLQQKLGIAVVDAGEGSTEGDNPGFAITGHSSSLVARFVSAINPRAIVFSADDTDDLVAMGFVRGEQFVELVSRNPNTDELNFFLLSFRQACNANESCTTGELLTPAIESNWTGYELYEDLDLENTVFDCLQCHQPDGPGTNKILRMQELQDPWTHFFRDNRAGGQALLADFQAAHGTNEDYAGIPAASIEGADPGDLEDFVRDAGFADQPNEFPTEDVEQEVEDSSPAQPTDNSVPGQSAAWQQIYARAVQGDVIAVPYHDVKVTDPTKLQQMTAAYQGYLSGATAAQQLPDIRDVFLTNQKHRMGFGVEPGLDGQGILDNGCKQCHNPKLNQTITRARFDTNLNNVSAEVIDRAIERIQLGQENPKRMPPGRFKDLKDSEKQLLIDYLEAAKANK